MTARPTLVEVGTVLAVVVTTGLVAGLAPPTPIAAAWSVGSLVLGAAFGAAAATVRRCGGERRTASVMSVVGFALLVDAVAAAGAPTHPVLAGLAGRMGVAVLALLAPGLALIFPTGRLEAWPERAAAVVVAVAGAALVIAPTSPVALPAAIAVITGVAGAVWARFERARDDDRLRILWLVYGVGAVGVVDGHLLFAVDGVANEVVVTVAWVVVLLCGLVLPAALAVALVAPRAVDVRRAIAVTVLAVLMVDLVLATYVGTIAVIQGLTGEPPPRAITAWLCVAIAAGFHPVLRRLREALDQVLFGGHADPVGVVSTLGGELRRGGDPQRWLDALRGAVDLPSAELWHGEERLAVSGPAGGPTTVVELWAGSELVGTLVVGLPEHHTELPRATEEVLGLAAAPLARALQSTRLAEELQRSRRRVVVASEEERRRLRRDLHDGLGPVLAGVAYTADAVRNVLGDDPDRASTLLAALREDVAGAIAEVRRLVHDLRPPALDQLGLLPALRQQSARWHRPDGAELAVRIDADTVGALPAAVEVTAYRLVSEALLNAARHSGATAATVRIAVEEGELALCVRDDGSSPAPWTPGVGLLSMRERVEQLGGWLDAGATAEGGVVRARLPLATRAHD